MKLTNPRWIAALVLLTGALASAGISQYIRQGIERQAVRDLSAQADQAVLKIRQQLWSYGITLRGGAGFFNGSRGIGREEWRAYVDKLHIGEHLPGVQGMGFAELIPRDRLDAHVARVRAEGFPGYRVHPEGERDLYSAIVYLEPFSGRNLRAFGFDMYAEPIRRAAMAQARDTGMAAMSGKVRLVQEDGQDEQAGFLLYFPVYRAGAPVQTVAQRRAALIGWAYSPYRMNDMMAAIFADWREAFGAGLHMAVYAGERETPEARLFDNFPAGATASRMVLQQRSIEFRGHRWRLICGRTLDSAGLDYTLAWVALGGGLVASLLLAGLAFSLARTRERAQQLADAMTVDLRASERRLQESEARWKFALEGSGLGVWDWYVPGGRVFYSQRWKEMLGYDAGDIGGSITEWESRLHPDDKAVVKARLQDCLKGRSHLYASEHRLLCKDGRYRWVLARGMVGERDALGQPLRMLGTHADIHEARESRARLERLDRLYAALSGCNSAIVHCTNEQTLFHRICEVVVQNGGLKMAWIGRIDPATRRILPVASFGAGIEYLDGIEISIDPDDEHGRGPSGTAARENRPVWSPDYAQNPSLAPWHARGAHHGWIASAALPICRDGKPVGVFNIYVGEGGFFDEDTRALLAEMASDISYALDRFALARAAEATRASLMESEERFQAIIGQSLAGAYIIQDSRFVYVNPRFVEIMGGSSAGDFIGRAPGEFLPDADRFVHEENLRRLMADEVRETRTTFRAQRQDGSQVVFGAYSSRASYRGRPAIIGLLQEVMEPLVTQR